MQKNIQAQETNTQNLRLILAPALLYLDQMGGFDINQPPINIFFTYEDALQYAEAKYDSV